MLAALAKFVLHYAGLSCVRVATCDPFLTTGSTMQAQFAAAVEPGIISSQMEKAFQDTLERFHPSYQESLDENADDSGEDVSASGQAVSGADDEDEALDDVASDETNSVGDSSDDEAASTSGQAAQHADSRPQW